MSETKKETFVTRWFKDNVGPHREILMEVCELTAKRLDEEYDIRTHSSNVELYAVVFYATMQELVEKSIRDKRPFIELIRELQDKEIDGKEHLPTLQAIYDRLRKDYRVELRRPDFVYSCFVVFMESLERVLAGESITFNRSVKLENFFGFFDLIVNRTYLGTVLQIRGGVADFFSNKVTKPKNGPPTIGDYVVVKESGHIGRIVLVNSGFPDPIPTNYSVSMKPMGPNINNFMMRHCIDLKRSEFDPIEEDDDITEFPNNYTFTRYGVCSHCRSTRSFNLVFRKDEIECDSCAPGWMKLFPSMMKRDLHQLELTYDIKLQIVDEATE